MIKKRHLLILFFLPIFLFPLHALAKCQYVVVKRVVDGDTFLTNSGQRVRLLGVDTPESVINSRPVQWFGKQAYWWLSERLTGKRVCLERDPNRAVNLDKYGRLLRYVWVGKSFLNREIIAEGIGRFYHREPLQYDGEFRKLQFEAIKQGKGIWDINAHRNWIKQKIERLKLLSSCGSNGYLCPWDAKDYIGKKIRVMLYVNKTHDAGSKFLLNSEVDYRAWDNLTVVVYKGRHSSVELDRKFWGHLIEVRGTVRLYKDRAEIVVKNPDEIRIIK